MFSADRLALASVAVTARMDRSFCSLPLEPVRSAALQRARDEGCRHAEVRVERVRSQFLQLRDGRLETSVDDVELGVGVRVVRDGSVGFAATAELSEDAASALATSASEVAQLTAPARRRRVELADTSSLGTIEWASQYELDPTEVPLSEKVELLSQWNASVLNAPGVDHVTAGLLCVAEDKHFADLLGTIATQRRVRVHPFLEALSLDAETGEPVTLRTLAPPVGRGFEYLTGTGWDFETELAEMPELLAEKRAAPSVEPGHYDLVIDPTNLWLTIHESVGHATELDRAMGYEAGMAGTSFATIDQLGSLAYGSELMNVTGDRTVAHGLASVAVDDEGVAAQSFDLVSKGILVGYQLDRAIAAEEGLGASNGCSFASASLYTPIQRMANVSLQPAPGDGPRLEDLIASVDRGIYVVGDRSWSIDMQRLNFQFTGQRFFRIAGGKLAGQVKDVAYQARTPDFWGAMKMIGGQSTYLLGGAFTCGKGQPMQLAPVSHGCPAALFSSIRILNTREESGR